VRDSDAAGPDGGAASGDPRRVSRLPRAGAHV